MTVTADALLNALQRNPAVHDWGKLAVTARPSGAFAVKIAPQDAWRAGAATVAGRRLLERELTRALGEQVTIDENTPPNLMTKRATVVIWPGDPGRTAALEALTAAGYAAEAEQVLGEAGASPGKYVYTADRHRCAVRHMPHGTWEVRDCEQSEEAIKALGRR